MKPTKPTKPGELDATLTPEQVRPDGDTIADTLSDPVGAASRPSPAAYKLGTLLGRGGMGEVVLADDVRIGRQVAVKRMRGTDPSPEATERFLREARIQARLDHPAIVPVHELGTDANGQPFFTMKRLEGTTLAEARTTATLQRLLRVFVDVCQAIEFAHARGVIHRDLKPANIMLGRYGEVYVLDWGVARVVDDGERESERLPDVESLSGDTQVGSVLGTPGYMSPEQVRGEPVTRATDVYALGAILFEILAGEPAHPPGHGGLVATLAEGLAGPAKRAPDRQIAPELDGACVSALGFDPSARPTAGALAATIQRYLDGDRDLAKRKELADQYLATARRAIESGDHPKAMQAANRALGLDPESEAAQVIGQLMLQPPKELPRELVTRLEAIDLEQSSKQARFAARAMLSYLTMFPVLVWMGIHDWQLVALMLALVAFNIAMALRLSRDDRGFPILIVTNMLLIITVGRIFGPFVFVPMLLTGISVAMISNPAMLKRPYVIIGAAITAYVTPIALEALGLWSTTWNVVGGAMEVRSPVVDLELEGVTVFLTVAGCILLTVMPMFVRQMARAQRESRRQVEIQVWHLEQLLPSKS